jgi:hypothetical protein
VLFQVIVCREKFSWTNSQSVCLSVCLYCLWHLRGPNKCIGFAYEPSAQFTGTEWSRLLEVRVKDLREKGGSLVACPFSLLLSQP